MKAQFKPRVNLEGRTLLQEVIPLDVPLILLVDPASACNFACRFCPTGDHEAIAATGRFQGAMRWDVFTKTIDDLAAFDRPIKVLRLYKDGEPLLNKRLADMIAYAKKSGRVESVDTSTNGALLTPERMAPVLEAGLDRINISVNGMNAEQYRSFTGAEFDFPAFVENVKWLYANKGSCEIVMKIPDDVINEIQRQEFLDTFGDYCDRIFIENAATCWPEFDVESHIGSKITKGMYGDKVGETDTCTYIFYSIAVNADGLVSACVMDWGRKLVVGDVKTQSVKDIWHSDAMNALRRQHLEGNRKDNPVCGRCGLLSYCLTDNIDGYRKELLPKFLDYAGDVKTRPPGMPT